MKRVLATLCLSMGLLSATTVLAQATAPGAAAKPAAAAKTAKTKPLMGEYGLMVSQLGLSDEQTATLTARIDAKVAALKAWNENEGKGVPELEKALKEATVAKDKAKVAALTKQIKEVTAPREALAAKHDKEIAGVLSHQQAETWEGFKAYRTLTSQFAKVNLTDDQKATLKAHAAKSGPALLAAGTDAKAKGTIMKDLHDAAVKDVLTADQRTALTAKPAPAAAPAKAPAVAPAPAAAPK